ncbi:hypothetical protein DSM104443_01177 [Usitatibacter rugosus]|uniref:Uncharacterized protein n=2 Tax=Usitatibacter rugosus TaxID=2732067 RepID=A0A6M4GUV8_9PROT|nr:hypothetical protein DSM104443_01177 [Usitatibacter rugosus]
MRATVSSSSPTVAGRYTAEIHATNRTEAYLRLVGNNDPAAIMVRDQLAGSCSNFVYSGVARANAAAIEALTNPVDKAKRKAVYDRIATMCRDFPFLEYGTQRTEVMRGLVASGDPRALLREPIEKDFGARKIAAAEAVAATKDPLALQEMGAFFHRRPDRGRDYQYDLGDGTKVGVPVIRDAFLMASCDFGNQCTADSGFVSVRCVTEGKCDATSVEDYLLRYNYPPAEAERLLAARQVIVRGINTGNWPPGFW